jgi:hypothetical protein
VTLIPIEHERRLTSAHEAAALFGGLHQRRISARGFHTLDPARFERLVTALVPEREHTISFEGGQLGAATLRALDALARSPFQYFDLRATNADLRIWPGLRTWVHTPERQVETQDISSALALFCSLTAERAERGFIQGVRAETKPLLVNFLTALGGRVNAVLELDLLAARSLTELYAGERLDWQADGVLVDFPEGRIHGFLTTPKVSGRDREKWLARIEKALGRAGLL